MRLRILLIISAVLASWLVGCKPPETHFADKSPPSAPAPIRIKSFATRPDAVILFTGQNSGKLEVCNCSGPMPGGFARRSGLVLSYRAKYPKSLLIDTGDLFSIYPTSPADAFILKAYRMMKYDAVTLADQEWESSFGKLKKLLTPGDLKFLSTSVSLRSGEPALPLCDVVTLKNPRLKVAIVSYILPEAFMFFPLERKAKLAFLSEQNFDSKIAQLKKTGYCVGVILHGDADETTALSNKLSADFYLRGHTELSEKKPVITKNGKPIYWIGTPEFVGVLAISKSDQTDYKFQFRAEAVDTRWPLDKRMLEIYQGYAHVAMRQALDAERKVGLDFVPSKTCGQCHPKQYEIWKKSRHARAWKSLERVKRTIDPNCVTCHSLGFGMKKGFYTFAKTPDLAGVHCQNCHRVNIADHNKPGFKFPPVTALVCETCHTAVTDPKFGFRQAQRFKKMGCRRFKKRDK